MGEEFRHNAAEQRFEAWLDGELIGEATYLLRDQVASFDHTFVQPDKRHLGVAGRLVQYAFDQVRAAGQWRIRTVCPYVTAWARRHPEYHYLLVSPPAPPGQAG